MRRPRRSISLALAVAGLAVIAATGAPAQAAPAITGPGASPTDTAIGTYFPITKNQRILDTRSTLGGHKGVLGARSEFALQVGGAAGLPTGDTASAVVLNLTGVSPTAATYVTAYPSGTTRPTVSSINLAPKSVRSNLVTVPVGADGKVKLYNNAGSLNLVVDVMGFYARTDVQGTYGIGSMYYISNPERWFDSRGDGGALAAGEGVDLSLDYGPADNADVRAFAVNITAISPTASGYITAWDGSTPMPNASSVNFVKGQVVPNMAVVPTSVNGAGAPTIAVVNGSASAATQVAVDIVGVYLANSASGLRFTPLAPTRIVDTRNGTGGFKGLIGAKVTKKFAAPGGVAIDPTFALVGNATAISPTAATYLTVFADGGTRPAVSSLNAVAGETVANAAVVNLGPGTLFDAYNNAGSLNLAMDVAGRFDEYTVPTAGLATSAVTSAPALGSVHVTRR